MQQVLAEKSCLEDVLDWMEGQFDGDLTTTAVAAFGMVKASNMVSGPLWNEVGVRILHHLYKINRIQRPRHDATRLTGDDDDNPMENKVIMYYNKGRYYNLLDMTAKEVKEVAGYYDSLVKGNAYERDFLLSVADRLAEGQVVGDVFNEDGLRELRREITNN